VDLIFRERAFWMFSTAHRLGDLRRLVKYYQRTPESVFPTGAWHKGGNYGPDVNFPVPQAEETNPNVTIGNTCTDRIA
jgi:starch-binding outer membrane protein, SusD/RagB family